MTTRIKTLVYKSNTSIMHLALLSALLMDVCPSRALAQDGHLHTPKPQQNETTLDQQNNAATLLRVVRESTERFKNVSVAEAEEYALQFGCVSGSDTGAMGIPYPNA